MAQVREQSFVRPGSLVLGSEIRIHRWFEVPHFANGGEGTSSRGERASAGEKRISPGCRPALEGRLVDNHTSRFCPVVPPGPADPVWAHSDTGKSPSNSSSAADGVALGRILQASQPLCFFIGKV